MPQAPEPFHEDDTDVFIRKIVEARNQGYRITPLVGAGLSRASGVPVTAELRRYLGYCVWRTLAHLLPTPGRFFSVTDASFGRPLFEGDRWDPRLKPWPDLPDLLADIDENLSKLNP